MLGSPFLRKRWQLLANSSPAEACRELISRQPKHGIVDESFEHHEIPKKIYNNDHAWDSMALTWLRGPNNWYLNSFYDEWRYQAV